jgi:glycosyltransferase involved in cell wall biosynthesis
VAPPSISAIVTAHNEGPELQRTLRSVVENTRSLVEVIVIDDGSDDGSCETVARDDVRVIHHERRVGVAYSRDEGSRQAKGDVLCYLDAHQRVSKGCLDRCAQLAVERDAITCPDLKDYGLVGWRSHGAEFQLCPKQGYFSARWRQWFSLRRVTPVTGLRAPPYAIPRSLYSKVAWSRSLQGWGASEASMVVKSFFSGIGILHLTGPLARHRFQNGFPYLTTWDGVWRNHAIIARVCFDDSTWFRYWLPKVFGPHLTDEARATLDSVEVQAEHADFLSKKVRTDRQFWTDLACQPVPEDI